MIPASAFALVQGIAGASGVFMAIFSAVIAMKRSGNKFITAEEHQKCIEESQILARDLYMSHDCYFTRRNLNVLVLGASGTGKSRFFVKPNLLQANTSFVVTDPSGELIGDTAGFLKNDKGYDIIALNLKDMQNSCRYNPFAYVHKQEDVVILMSCLQKNINKDKQAGGDPFWDKSALALLVSCGAYLFEAYSEDEEFVYDEKGRKIQALDDEGKPVFLTNLLTGEFLLDKNGNKIPCWERNKYWKGHRNLTNLMNMLRMGKIEENSDGSETNDLDQLFADWEEQNPKSYAVKQYKTFKMAPAKTALNIMISVGVMVGTYFDNDMIQNLTYVDEMHMETIGERKTACYIILPEGDDTFAFLSAMFYTQLFEVLYAAGESNGAENGGDPSLKVPVRIFLDEMANIGKIPQFQEKLATMRKYKISAVPIFQSLTQLKTCYKDDWSAIIGNCDTTVFLGGAETETLKWISEKLGKKTVSTLSYGQSYAKNGSYSDNKQQIARNVMDPNEVEQIPNHKCLVIVRGVAPFFIDKYMLEAHPNYERLGSKCKANLFPASKFHIDASDEEIGATMIIAPSDERYLRVFPENEVGADDKVYVGRGPKYHGLRYKESGKRQNADSLKKEIDAKKAKGKKGEEKTTEKSEGNNPSDTPVSAEPVMSEDEKALVNEVLSHPGLDLTCGELKRIMSSGVEEAKKFVELKEAYCPEYEFLDGDIGGKFLIDDGDDEEEDGSGEKELMFQDQDLDL